MINKAYLSVFLLLSSYASAADKESKFESQLVEINEAKRAQYKEAMEKVLAKKQEKPQLELNFQYATINTDKYHVEIRVGDIEVNIKKAHVHPKIRLLSNDQIKDHLRYGSIIVSRVGMNNVLIPIDEFDNITF